MDKRFQALLADVEDIFRGTELSRLVKQNVIKNEVTLARKLTECMAGFTKEQLKIAQVILKELTKK